jgi:hypothetical protein
VLAVAVTAAAELSNREVALWGALGGAIALTVTQILPAAVAAAKTGAGWQITPWRVAGVLVVIIVFVALGGAAALLFQKDTTKVPDAIAFGMAWEALIGGVIKTGKAGFG